MSTGIRKMKFHILNSQSLSLKLRLLSEIFIHCNLRILFVIFIILFPYLTTPLSIGCCLLLTTIRVALNRGSNFTDLWISYILVLVFLGGVLVIFIYVALVSSNEQFNVTLKPILPLIFRMPIILWSIITNNKIQNNISIPWVEEVYRENLYILTLFLILYLFLTLIVVVSNTKRTKITLRRF